MVLPRVGLENSWLQSRQCALAFSPVCLYSIQNFSFQVFPIGRAVPTPAVPLGCQTVPVSSVREEVRPQRPPVQTHQSPPFSTNQPDGSHCKLMRGGLGSLRETQRERRSHSHADASHRSRRTWTWMYRCCRLPARRPESVSRSTPYLVVSADCDR